MSPSCRPCVFKNVTVNERGSDRYRVLLVYFSTGSSTKGSRDVSIILLTESVFVEVCGSFLIDLSCRIFVRCFFLSTFCRYPYFYIAELGFTGVNIIFLFLL